MAAKLCKLVAIFGMGLVRLLSSKMFQIQNVPDTKGRQAGRPQIYEQVLSTMMMNI